MLEHEEEEMMRSSIEARIGAKYAMGQKRLPLDWLCC
jgi:hypothetical protein